MLEYFTDWQKKTVKFQTRTETQNAVGQVTTSWVDGDTLSLNWWTDTSRETNVNDKFVDKATGRALLSKRYGVSPDTTMRMYVSDSEIYQIVGVDDVAEFGEFYVLNWIRDL